MMLPEENCEVCNYKFKKEDNVITHVIEDETGSAMVGFTVCESCNEKHEYHYGVAEMAYKPWFTQKTVIVAPLDAEKIVDIKPDHICKGKDDQKVIQNALDSLEEV